MDEVAFDAIAYLNSPRWRFVRLGLARIARLMALLGDPQDDLRIVHVAGTNGKGSTCAYLASILRSCGLKTGLFTSPYLVEFAERIQVDGEMIAPDDLDSITRRVREAAQRVEEELGEHPTEFELMCAVAFCYFAHRHCDVAVVEVGLGGRYDSTNIVHADLCVITPIGLDHMRILGSSIEQIASEKAGIIKQGDRVVSGPQREGARAMLLERCNETDARISFLDADEVHADPPDIVAGRQSFSYAGKRYETRLLGAYQPQNASLAILAVRTLAQAGDALRLGEIALEECIRRGIETASWPGRFEVLLTDPLLIVDGAHNHDGALALRASLLALGEGLRGKVVFVMGVLEDKDRASMVEAVADLAAAFVVYTPPTPRAYPAEALGACIEGICSVPVCLAGSIPEALDIAKGIVAPDGIIVAFGTLYAIGSIKESVDSLA